MNSSLPVGTIVTTGKHLAVVVPVEAALSFYSWKYPKGSWVYNKMWIRTSKDDVFWIHIENVEVIDV